MAKSAWLLGVGIYKQVAKLLPGLVDHAIPHDQAVAAVRVTLKTQEANRLSFRKRNRLAEIEQGFRLVHVIPEDALEALDVSGARGVAPALRRS